jgi:hypothetical protein
MAEVFAKAHKAGLVNLHSALISAAYNPTIDSGSASPTNRSLFVRAGQIASFLAYRAADSTEMCDCDIRICGKRLS